ncbi:hypothetical protein SAMN04244579_02684 [Azotobacter beijerinckii]|uniref:Uncharacterized protein n=1 Tax=Azotobacter beijerinckii TaxID=170623 RepID=A0A1H6V1A5_9GAMM|nr:hypothetical protein [Azotobacter beijerinckii]SEI98281.1 hypothetical protein SAMN04244579_02684 [Azotobacter beijerinckii]
MTTRSPSVALAWLRAGYSVRIVPLNDTAAAERRDYWRHIRALATLEARA